MIEQFEPTIIGFTCNWCSYRAADLAGTARLKYPPNIRLIRLMCSGRLDPTFVLQAFALGADGVMLTGCHPGECHYIEQNYKALRRYMLLQRLLAQMGIEPERLKLVWASAAEGAKFAEEVTRFVEQIRALGPLNWGDKVQVSSGKSQVTNDNEMQAPSPVTRPLPRRCPHEYQRQS
ncbi:MAG: hydrogenase iron-sulfur subunit [Chloroflexi bacterium]|nr:hydrogenase iron-sulfur subunit [Chloroflexota bacterium]